MLVSHSLLSAPRTTLSTAAAPPQHEAREEAAAAEDDQHGGLVLKDAGDDKGDSDVREVRSRGSKHRGGCRFADGAAAPQHALLDSRFEQGVDY